MNSVAFCQEGTRKDKNRPGLVAAGNKAFFIAKYNPPFSDTPFIAMPGSPCNTALAHSFFRSLLSVRRSCLQSHNIDPDAIVLGNANL